MPAEREVGTTGNGMTPILNGRRQPSSGGTSRMMREYHVKSTYEAHERVATESQIRAARVPTAPVAVFEQLSDKSLLAPVQ